MLLCSPISVSLCFHLLAIFDLPFFSTRAPQPSFSVSLSYCTHALHFLCFCLFCSVRHLPSMHHSSSLYFSCCTLLLLHTSIPFNKNTNLFFVQHTYSLCAPCSCYLAMLLHALPMSSALPNHRCNSSASLAVKPMRPSSLGVMPLFLHLSSSRDSSSSLEITHKSLRVLWQKPSMVFGSYSANLEMEPSYASSFHLRDHQR
jgi:hypothetical protein